MSNRKFFALGLLASLALMGCAEGSSDSALCGNGVVDAGEMCDGTALKPGVSCPTNTTGSLKCTNTCQIDTSDCKATVPVVNCGNGTLDAGEACDGAQFAAGQNVCPTGTTGTVKCSVACTIDTTACIPNAPAEKCGNSTLDDGEDCDGDKFAEGKNACPTGTTGNVKCSTACTVDTTACIPNAPAEKCGNGTLDDGEDCDGDKFAEGKDVCPAGTKGDVKCSTTCSIDTTACVAEEIPTTCGNGTIEDGEECDVDAYPEGKDVCPAGTTGKVSCNKACKIDTTGCKQESITTKCENNVFILEDDNVRVEQNCTAKGKICDENDGCKAYDKGFTCDGTTLKLKDTTFTYDCKNNADVDGSEDKVGCNPAKGCSDFYCDGQKLMMCVNGACSAEDSCDSYGNDKVVCSDKEKACVCTEEVSFCYQSGEDTYYAVCGTDAIASEKCDGDATCSDADGCTTPGPKTCGDAYVDSSIGETCDWWDNNGTKVIYVKGNQEATCNYYDSNKLFVSGAPTCPNTCKLNVATCIEAKDSDYKQVKSYTITSLQDIKNLTTSGEAKMNGTFGSGNSEYKDGGWSLGNWTTGTNFGKSVEFKVGAVSDNGVRITLSTQRVNNTNSPKRIQIKILDNGQEVYTSDVVILRGTDKVPHTFTYKHTKSSFTNMSFQFGAFDAKSEAHIVISDIKVSSVKAI